SHTTDEFLGYIPGAEANANGVKMVRSPTLRRSIVFRISRCGPREGNIRGHEFVGYIPGAEANQVEFVWARACCLKRKSNTKVMCMCRAEVNLDDVEMVQDPT
ncbi:10163_t:CDS:2, partial [Racocetra persica]